MCSCECKISVLERQVKSLRIQVHEHEEYIDTVSSALWKRILWWFSGYYFRKVGRWYGD